MKRLLAPILLLAFAATSRAEITVTGETKVAAYKIAQFTVDSTVLKDAAVDLDLDDTKLDLKRLGNAFCVTGPAGTYPVKVFAFGVGKDGKPAVERKRFSIVIGDAPPVPPGPGPVPPPVPPDPVDSPLTKAVKAAYATEADPAKAAQVKGLASVYRAAADPAMLAQAPTWGQLFSAMAASANAVGVRGKLPAVQAVIQGEIKSAGLPQTPATALDAAGRDLASRTFARVATALEGIK